MNNTFASNIFSFHTKIENIKQFERCHIGTKIYVVAAVPTGYVMFCGTMIFKLINEEVAQLRIKDQLFMNKFQGPMTSKNYSNQFSMANVIFIGEPNGMLDHQACFASPNMHAARQVFDLYVKEYKNACKRELNDQIAETEKCLEDFERHHEQYLDAYRKKCDELKYKLAFLISHESKINQPINDKPAKLKPWNFIYSDHDMYVFGKAYNHPTIENGKEVRSSSIIKVIEATAEYVTLQTKNTLYRLHFKDFSGEDIEHFKIGLQSIHREE